MADVTIPLAEKATRPAVPAKEFSEEYILDLHIRAHAMGADDTIYGESCPYDQATGDRLLTQRDEVRQPLWEIIQNVPEAAEAYAAIAKAWPAIKAYQKAKAEAEAAEAAASKLSSQPTP